MAETTWTSIPVKATTRNRIRNAKGEASYSALIEQLLERKTDG